MTFSICMSMRRGSGGLPSGCTGCADATSEAGGAGSGVLLVGAQPMRARWPCASRPTKPPSAFS